MSKVILKNYEKSFPSDRLKILENFLADIGKGYMPDKLEYLHSEWGAFNSMQFERIKGNKVLITYQPIMELDKLKLEMPFDEFISVSKKWMELTEKKVDKIILTEEDDGSFTIKEG